MARSVFPLFVIFTSVFIVPLSGSPVTIDGSVQRRRGVVVDELCQTFSSCSRLTYEHNMTLYALSLQRKRGAVSFGIEFAGTGGRVAQPSVRDEDWWLPGYVTKQGPRIDLYRLRFHDSPYGINGESKDSDAWSKTALATYRVAPSFEWSLSEHWGFVARYTYEFFHYRRYDGYGVLSREKMRTIPTSPYVTSDVSFLPYYFSDFGYYEVNIQEAGLGVTYRMDGGPYRFQVNLIPTIGQIYSRDDHGPGVATVWRTDTSGGGLLVALAFGYRLTERLELDVNWSGRRLYTRGEGNAYGLRPLNRTGFYYIRFRGSDVGIKESQLGMTFRLQI